MMTTLTTIRTRLSPPMIVLLALMPFLITGICLCGPQFFRLAKMAPSRIDTGSAFTSTSTAVQAPVKLTRSVGVAATAVSGASLERKSDETISRFMNHESSATPDNGVLCFFFAIHGLAAGAFVGAMKAKLI
jgi:hypothetical protein